MKKHIIAAAVAAAVAAPAAFAGAPTVYGQINMSVDAGKLNGADQGTLVSSNASRVGIKGAEDLGNGLKAIYKMEFGVPVDSTSKPQLSGRNAYVGLAGGFGAVLLGRHDTPLKMAQPTDLFNDGYADLNPMAGGLGVAGKAGEVRAGNVLAYVSPSFSGIKLVAALVPYEDGKKSSLTDVYSVAVMYGSKKKGLFLSGAYNNWTNRSGSDSTEYRLSAQYTMGALMGNIMYQNFDKTGKDGNNFQVNLGYTIGAATLKGKYSHVDYDKTVAAKDGDGFGLGVDYALGKKTTAYIEYANMDKKTLKGETSIVSLGLLHKF
ncbi:porin [Alcanivorax sp.]|uniref:porin n=1 Tax=Alcanivorax sp. TaxID=1872427 RepID=UPI0025841D19|nr:porin [Alcanivorax sp.]